MVLNSNITFVNSNSVIARKCQRHHNPAYSVVYSMKITNKSLINIIIKKVQKLGLHKKGLIDLGF